MIRIKNANETLSALYFLQFSFLVFLSPLTSFNAIIAVSSAMLVAMFVLINIRHRLVIPNPAYLVLLLFPVLFIMVKTLCFPQDFDANLGVAIDFVTICAVSLTVGIFPFGTKEFLSKIESYAIPVFVSLMCLPFLGIAKFGGYMRFGYAMLPICNLFLVCLLVQDHKQKCIKACLYLIALFEMVVFGARGALFCHLLFALLYFVFIATNRKYFILKCVLLMIGLILSFNLEPILLFLKTVLNSFGLKTYAINKYILQLNEGVFAASSGRRYLWDIGLNQIKQHPFWGGTLSFKSIASNSSQSYYHNFFIQLAAEFGIPLALLAIGLIIKMFVKVCKYGDNDSKCVFFILFSISFGRLLFSSTYWARPELWLLLGMYCSDKFFSNEKCTCQMGVVGGNSSDEF